MPLSARQTRAKIGRRGGDLDGRRHQAQPEHGPRQPGAVAVGALEDPGEHDHEDREAEQRSELEKPSVQSPAVDGWVRHQVPISWAVAVESGEPEPRTSFARIARTT